MGERLKLPNKCWASEFSVNPKNWNKTGTTTKKDWQIQYYFHDPAFGTDEKLKYGKLVRLKGMNHLTTLPECRAAVRLLGYPPGSELQSLRITETFLNGARCMY